MEEGVPLKEGAPEGSQQAPENSQPEISLSRPRAVQEEVVHSPGCPVTVSQRVHNDHNEMYIQVHDLDKHVGTENVKYKDHHLDDEWSDETQVDSNDLEHENNHPVLKVSESRN